MNGPAMTLLTEHAGTPAAKALDMIAASRSEILSSTAGEWTPALCLDHVQALIDAEVRLGRGADMEGVARQVAGLMLIALERLELENVARHTREAAEPLMEEGISKQAPTRPVQLWERRRLSWWRRWVPPLNWWCR